MKKILVISLISAFAACGSKNNVAGSDSNSVIVSMNGIGDLKIGMKKESVEKLLKRKITLPHLTQDSNNIYVDTVSCNYKGIECMVVFTKELLGDTSAGIRVSEIKSSSPLLKTRSGISVGDDKIKIVNTYDGYSMTITPDIDYGKTPPFRSKTKSTIWLSDNGGSDNVIVFYLESNKVEGISVHFFEGE